MTLQPRPHQIAALDALDKAWTIHDRAQLIMACGTGKTLTCRWQAIRAGSTRTLVLLPSLLLVAQTLREWRRTGPPFRAIVVCSDPATATGKAERDEESRSEDLAAFWVCSRAKVTTSPAQVARFLEDEHPDRPQVVFSTYHSCPVVERAQQLAGVGPFDLMICDEAHRLAGLPTAAFQVPTDGQRIQARRRLFATATPQIVTGPDSVLSMDDEKVFGPVAHAFTFGEAIGARLLCDYRVVVVGHRPGTGRISETLPAVLSDAMSRFGLRRLITFHGRVAKAKAFADLMNGVQLADGRRVGGRHISGYMAADDRRHALEWLGQDALQPRLLSNARCLTEGIDVPAVDGIIFADPYTSPVAITQAIGRALRPAPGKTVGTIIVPVAVDNDGDDDSALASSTFAHVWAVLRALRAHDLRFARELDTAAREVTPRGPYSLERVHFLLPEDMDPGVLMVRAVRETGLAWDRFYALLQDYTADRTRYVAANLVWQGEQLGKWVYQQRIAYSKGVLDPGRIRQLEAIPGWAWTWSASQWNRTFARLADLAQERGSLEQPVDASSIYDGVKVAGEFLGIWVATQRQLYRDGVLASELAARLETLPGWSWDGGLSTADVTLIQALRQFSAFEKHADVPDDHREDDLPLGRWVLSIRRRNITGHLHPALPDEITAAIPRGDKGQLTFLWKTAETRWRIAFSALRQYTNREGHSSPPAPHKETLSDIVISLGQWVARQRFLYHRQQLEPEYVSRLEAMPGWAWKGPTTRKDFGEPLDLGGHPHGTAKGIAAGCPCATCLPARRADDRERLAERRRRIVNPVPAAASRRHLQTLYQAGVRTTAIAATSKVPLGAIKKIDAGQQTISRAHEAALLATTAGACSRALKVGSRGRLVNPDNESIDAGPTWEIINGLVARGFGIGWISRELGYANGLKFRKDVIARRNARLIADLAERVGDLTAPDWRPVPPLAELLAGDVPVRRRVTVSQLADIRRRRDAGESLAAIAADVGVSADYLSRLARGLSKPAPDPEAVAS
ncbi:Helicase associated domain protein [Streptosporangium sp. NPDC001559]|uniref:Helicase associated domain protein n=1 Tax=Streptosporangium sp. NPDC001559 TaxID=3366187 RepID=UPI0036DFF36D